MPNEWVSPEVRATCYKNRDTVDAAGQPRNICHHIDFNHNNNDPENLIFLSVSEHNKVHANDRRGDYWDKVSKTMSEVKKLNPIRYWKNKNLSEDHRQKISDSLKGNTPWNKGLKTGIVTSDETKAKLSASLKGRHKVIIDGKIRFVK